MSFEWKDVANYLWLAILPLLKWIWIRQEQDVAAVAADLRAHVKADMESFVTKDQYQHHKDTIETTRAIRSDIVDREMAANKREIESVEQRRRDGDTELHGRIDMLKDAMNEGFMETQRLIMERLPK